MKLTTMMDLVKLLAEPHFEQEQMIYCFTVERIQRCIRNVLTTLERENAMKLDLSSSPAHKNLDFR